MGWLLASPVLEVDRSTGPASTSHHRVQVPRRVLIPVTVTVLGCFSASRGDQTSIGAWGLVQALPAPYLLCTAALTVSFLVELLGRRPSSGPVLAAHLVGMVFLLHGAPALLESEPRFATAWLHAGFTDQILDRGVAAPKVDARFNWPGFFGAGAAIVGSGGLDTALSLLRWAPVALVLLYLPPLFVIARHLGGSRRAAWLGTWLFLLVNWVGQDYYAPQTVGFALYLLCIAVIVLFFRDGRRVPTRTGAWADRLAHDGLTDLAAGPRLRGALVVLLVLAAAALAVSHQLSPIALVLGSASLVLVGRNRLAVYPVVAGVLTLGWISVGATPYWLGHLGTIFGGIGNVDAVVSNSVGERIAGSGPHLTLVHLRLGFTLAIWTVTVAAALRLWSRGRPPLTLAALAVAPCAMVVQNYGNEGVLRIFLFSSPFACLVLGQALSFATAHWPGRALTGAVALALVPVFLLARYGNESFEQVRPDEVRAMEALFRDAPPGAELVSPTSQVPWRFAHVIDYDFSRPRDAAGFREGEPAAVRLLAAPSHAHPATYLVVTTSQLLYGYEALGEPPLWFEKVRPLLTPANGYRLVYQNDDAVVYSWEAP